MRNNNEISSVISMVKARAGQSRRFGQHGENVGGNQMMSGYVGITDSMDETVKYFNKEFGFDKLIMKYKNINGYEGYSDIKLNDDIKDTIKKNNKYDYKLYNHYKKILKEVINDSN